MAHSSNSNVTLFLLMLQKHYGKNLLPFECHFERGGVDPAPILAQVEAQSKKKKKKRLAASLSFSRKTGTEKGKTNSSRFFPSF